MQIYIFKDNQQTGPFEELEILDQLRTGKLSRDDLGFKPGAANWQKLGELFPDVSHQQATPPVITPHAAVISKPAQAAVAQSKKGGGCRIALGIAMILVGLLMMASGIGGVAFFQLSPKPIMCEFADKDKKELDTAMEEYQAAKGTDAEAVKQAEVEVILTRSEDSSRLCSNTLAQGRIGTIAFAVAAIIGFIVLVIGIFVARPRKAAVKSA
jgi:hypothetical protein